MSTPQFLQQFYERARKGRTAFERHQAAFLGWEYGLRMLASVALVEYAERGIQDDKLAPALQNLACPSLGHWWEIVRLLVKRLAEEGDAGFQQVQSVLLGKKRDDLLDCIRLDVALQRALNKGVEPVARHAVSLLELGDRLVAYRNIQYHAAIGLREDDFYAEMTVPMLAGISQLWLSVDVLAGRQLIYVAEVRRLPTGNWRIDHWDLGQVQPESSYTDVAHEQVASLPLANRLYVATREPGPGGPATGDAWEARAWQLLYPLALYEPDQHELFLYGSSNQRKARVAYVGCVSGEHVQMVEGPEQLKLLSRLLHTAVSEAQLAQWAEKIQTDIATSIPIPETQERRRLGEFTLLSRLGQGASGTVYRAWQPSLQRIVAVKRLLRANDPKAQERFLREIRSLGRVRHPHLVEAYNGGTDGEDVYFAMELVEGADLGRVIEQLAGSDVGRVDSRAWQTAVSSAHACARAQEQPLSADDEVVSSSAVARQSTVADAAARFSHGHVRHVVEMLRDVTDAVQALHDKQIIHRDIKPGNILVTSSGDAVLTDLGLAQLLDADTITRSQQFVGTVRYSSPEQMFDASRVDFRSDVYSLGATLWELLTLRPLLGITPELPLDEAFRRIRRHDPESVRTYNSQVPDDLARVIAKCLRKDETQRYRTAGELSSDLTRWLAGEPVLADNPTLGYLLSKALRRHAKPIAAAGLLLALLVTLFFVWFVTVNRARNEAIQAGTKLKDALDRRDVALRGEERANRELSDKLVALNDETVRVLFASGCLKYEFGRVLEGQRELAQAYRAISENNPRRSGYRRVLLDRLQVDRGLTLQHAATVNCVAFSPDGKRLVTGSADGTARLWDAQTGQPLGEVMRHQKSVWAAAFSPDGTRVVTGADDRTARLWDAQTGQPLGEVMRHKKSVWAAAFSPDGTRVVTGSSDKTARVWDAQTGRPIGEVMRHENSVRNVAFSPDGTQVVVIEDRSVHLWDAQAGRPIGDVIRRDDAAGSPPNSAAATGGEDHSAPLSDAQSGKRIDNAEEYVISVAFSPDGTRVVTAEYGAARLWNAQTGQPIGEVMRHDAIVRAVAFSPDGTRIVTGSNGKWARLWDGQTGENIHDLKAMPDDHYVTSLAFSPDGRRVVTGSSDRHARIWDAVTGRLPIGDVMRATMPRQPSNSAAMRRRHRLSGAQPGSGSITLKNTSSPSLQPGWTQW
ncbi:MAG: serine/threonine-protein kinase [Pirellulales bacterium]